jgi:phosphate transport system permease protein
MLPAVVMFSIGYLLWEGHSYGWKLAFLTSGIAVLSGFAGYLNVEFAVIIAGLSALAAVLEIRKRRKAQVKPKDLSIVTENIAKFGLRLSGVICVVILIGMIAYITVRASPYLSWDFFTSSNWGFTNTAKIIQGASNGSMGGILPFATGSLLLAGVCELISIPLGLGAAIYLSEYSSQNKLTEIVRYFIETLAGVPSVIIGLVGLAVFVIALGWGNSLMGAAISLAFMTLPWNIRIAEEALKSVPKSYREASYALGATKWQTTRHAVLFAASPGIITGVLLGFGAALGETIVVALTGGWNPPGNIGVNGELSTYTILPPITKLFSTHQTIPNLPVFIWQAPQLMQFSVGHQNLNLAFMQYGVVLAASFYLVVMYLGVCGIALIARNYLSKKIRGR